MAHIQGIIGTPNNSSGLTSYSITLGSALTVGNIVCVAVFYNTPSTSDLFSSTTDGSNTYVPVTTTSNAATTIWCRTLYAKVTGAQSTITFHFSGAGVGSIEAVADEFSATTVFDAGTGQSQVTPGTGTDAVTSGNITTHAANDLIWGVTGVYVGTNGTVAVGTNYTQAETDASGSGYSILTEYRTLATPGSVAATFTDSSGAGNDYLTCVIGLQPVIPVVDDQPLRSASLLRVTRRVAHPQPNYPEQQPVTRFQTFTPPIGFDEDRGIQTRRVAWRAHPQPNYPEQQQVTRFQTFTPPIGFDEDRGIQVRRVAWRAHPQPDYPEQQPVTQFQTFSLPIGFDEDRGVQIRRVSWRAHPDVLTPNDFLFPTIFVPIGFDEDRGRQVQRVAWRQHTQAVTDDWLQAPTIFVPLGFDEDRGRQQRQRWLAHPQPQDDWLQSVVIAPTIEPWGFDEEQHFQIRRVAWRQHNLAVSDTFIQAPTVFVPLGFDGDQGRQQRRLWVAHPQPQDDWLQSVVVAPTVEPWGFDEEQHFQVRRIAWRQRSGVNTETILAPTVFVPLGFEEVRGRQQRLVRIAHPQPQDDWLFSVVLPPPVFGPFGFEEYRGILVRRVRWTAHPQPQEDWIGGIFPFVPPPIILPGSGRTLTKPGPVDNVPGTIGVPGGAPNSQLATAMYLTQLVSGLNNWAAKTANAVNYSLIQGAPQSSTSRGETGQIAFDSKYFYVCTAPNTWARIALLGDVW